MNKIIPRYVLIKSEIYITKYEPIKVYGIKDTNLENNIFIKDISSNFEKVQKFIDECNLYSVSHLNIEDVLEDYIS